MFGHLLTLSLLIVGSSVKPMPQFPVLLIVNNPPTPHQLPPPMAPSSPPWKDIHEREEHCVWVNKQCAELYGGATERGELTAHVSHEHRAFT